MIFLKTVDTVNKAHKYWTKSPSSVDSQGQSHHTAVAQSDSSRSHVCSSPRAVTGGTGGLTDVPFGPVISMI